MMSTPHTMPSLSGQQCSSLERMQMGLPPANCRTARDGAISALLHQSKYLPRFLMRRQHHFHTWDTAHCTVQNWQCWPEVLSGIVLQPPGHGQHPNKLSREADLCAIPYLATQDLPPGLCPYTMVSASAC
jgi:hypothetical protein